jgi:hypothetical protein
MTHPIVALQGALVAALRATPGLTVFDAPPPGQTPPYVVLARHDLRPRDGDAAPGNEHRLVLHAWAAGASRKAALTLADTVLTAALEGMLAPAGLTVTLRRHERTETAIDARTGRARAAIALTFYTEPE